MPRRKIDWRSVDWHRPNIDIAQDLACAQRVVGRMRDVYAPETVGQYRSPVRASSIAALRQPRTPETVARAYAASMEHPHRRKGPDQAVAREWALQAPDGMVWRGRNLYEFVRTHPDLFAPEDRAWKRAGGTGTEYCAATVGLGKLRHQRPIWKGWTLAE